MVACYYLLPGNAVGLFSKEKVINEVPVDKSGKTSKKKEVRKPSEQANNVYSAIIKK